MSESEQSKVNTQILDSVEAANRATIIPSLPRVEGADKASQAVAQATAMAIQDATDNLRNAMTIATTATGVAMSQLLATGDPKYCKAVICAQGVIDSAACQFKNIGGDAANVLSGFKLRADGTTIPGPNS